MPLIASFAPWADLSKCHVIVLFTFIWQTGWSMVYGTQTSDGSEEMEHIFPLGIFRPEKQAFHMFCCSQKFSAGTTQKGAFYLLSNQNLWKLLVNGKQPQKQLQIEVHQSQSMTFATRLSKHLFPKRSSKMITPSNNKIFGEWLSPLVWVFKISLLVLALIPANLGID